MNITCIMYQQSKVYLPLSFLDNLCLTTHHESIDDRDAGGRREGWVLMTKASVVEHGLPLDLS
jgi:hypothetical protein